MSDDESTQHDVFLKTLLDELEKPIIAIEGTCRLMLMKSATVDAEATSNIEKIAEMSIYLQKLIATGRFHLKDRSSPSDDQ